MILVSGKQWTGSLQSEKTIKATGQINGYSWLFKAKKASFLVEIADDKSIAPTDLPLVGFGCSGWLYESAESHLPNDERELVVAINDHLAEVFALFTENKLRYLPAVSCPCSE